MATFGLFNVRLALMLEVRIMILVFLIYRNPYLRQGIVFDLDFHL